MNFNAIPRALRRTPSGARVVRHINWYHRLYNATPLRIRRWFWK